MSLGRRRFITGGASLLGAAWFGGPARAGQATALGGSAFGTYWRAVLAETAPRAAAAAAIAEVAAQVDAAMSPFRADSEISRFNRSGDTEWQAASAPFCTVTGESLRIAALTGGAFEPTIGPLVHRYGFGPIEGEPASYRAVEAGTGGLRKGLPHLTLDLCGIAKGYALDRMLDAVAALGIGEALIELGGEVRTLGAHPEGRPWQVAVESPLPGATVMQRLVRPDGFALATSGDRDNAVEFAGRRYSHIIDPRSRAPIANGVASVTVLAPTTMEADALATAMAVLGADVGAEAAERLGRPALFLLHDGAAGVREVMAGGFENHLIG